MYKRLLLLMCWSLAAAASGRPACPEDANLWSCVDWCKVAAPGSSGSLSGNVCAHLSDEQVKLGRGPHCTCYDENHEKVLSECVSVCPTREDDIPSENDDEGVCTVGDSSCEAARKFLLYDVKMGEGFNLQREVFPRAGWLVWKLNEEVKKRCGGKFGVGKCAEWALVLPPWCQVAHWWSGPELVFWREFFDQSALRSPKLPVLEFDEFVKERGAAQVDLVISHTDSRIPKDERYGQKGGFYGWAKNRESCSTVVSHKWQKDKQLWNVQYAGSCQGGIDTPDYRCGVLSSHLDRDMLDLLTLAGKNVTSILLKGGDSIGPPEASDLDRVGLREAMLFASPLRKAGDDFIKTILGGKPYLAVHCRRTDFLRAHPKTTPGAEAIAAQIEVSLKRLGIDRVFVATDAPDDLREGLKSRLGASINFLDDAPEILKRLGDHKGKRAVVEMWLAARAKHFIGTQESRFTMHIELERGWLGKQQDTSEEKFCKEPLSEGQNCRGGAGLGYPKKASKHRASYWDQ